MCQRRHAPAGSSQAWITSGRTSTGLQACQDAPSVTPSPRSSVAGDLGSGRVAVAHRPAVRAVLRLHQRERAPSGPDPDQAGRAGELRSSLIEGVSRRAKTKTLMDRYLSGRTRSQGADRGSGEGRSPGAASSRC